MIRRTRLALVLGALPLLAACAEGTTSNDFLAGLGLPGSEPPEPEQPEPLPPAVQRAMPPGAPPSIVLTDASGCYLFSIERTDPPSGYYVRDENGNPICQGGTVPPELAGTAPPAADAAGTTDDATDQS